jgi:hypothetical protein
MIASCLSTIHPKLEASEKKTRLARYGLLTRGARRPYNSGLASSASRAR